jgi:hypothetical protein
MQYTPFYTQSPWPERALAGWENTPEEQRMEYLDLAIKHGYATSYWRALKWTCLEGPFSAHYTEDEKESVRREIQDYLEYLQAGEAEIGATAQSDNLNADA